MSLIVFFSARERAEFNKSCNLIGSWSGRNFLIRIATAGGVRRCVMSSRLHRSLRRNFFLIIM